VHPAGRTAAAPPKLITILLEIKGSQSTRAVNFCFKQASVSNK
jgi:hypothetical protein